MFKLRALLPLLALPAFAQQDTPGLALPGKIPPLTFPVPKVLIPPTVVYTLPQSCPVGIDVRPQSTPQSLRVASAVDVLRHGNAQGKTGVHVRLFSATAPIQEATVSVLYRAYSKGLVLMQGKAGALQQKTFELKAFEADVLDRNLLVGGFVTIDRVRVLKIVYADGTEWKAARPATCSAKPSPIVLVGAR